MEIVAATVVGGADVGGVASVDEDVGALGPAPDMSSLFMARDRINNNNFWKLVYSNELTPPGFL